VRQIEKKGLRESEIVVESALFVRVATKGLRGIFVRPKGCGGAGRLTGSGELTTKADYHISYWKSRRTGWKISFLVGA
jgi:hypothetical protein